jgi:hypothetical protein
MNFRNKAWLGLLGVTLIIGCAYERRSTVLYPLAARPMKTPPEQPKDLWSVTVFSAQLSPRKPSGLIWDNDNTPPDPYVQLFVDDRLVWESPVVEDTIDPQWNIVLPRNVMIRPTSAFRIEVWDQDTAPSRDPIGRLQRIGLPPTAQPNAVTRLMMDTGAVVTIKFAPPMIHKGVGITWFEVRPTALVVLEVEKYSPAGRAGIRDGDKIVMIDNHSIESLGDSQACSLLSLAAERRYSFEVEDAKGAKRAVKLDTGFVWLTM